MPAKTNVVPIDGAAVFDLDARRAARLEKAGGSRTVRFGGREWNVKAELPIQVVEDFAKGDVRGAFARILVDPEESAAFLAADDLSQADMSELLAGVYGLDLGKV